jgi:hypothetical protein
MFVVVFRSRLRGEATPEHVEAQQLGREHHFEEYRIQVCTPVREYSFRR